MFCKGTDDKIGPLPTPPHVWDVSLCHGGKEMIQNQQPQTICSPHKLKVPVTQQHRPREKEAHDAVRQQLGIQAILAQPQHGSNRNQPPALSHKGLELPTLLEMVVGGSEMVLLLVQSLELVGGGGALRAHAEGHARAEGHGLLEQAGARQHRLHHHVLDARRQRHQVFQPCREADVVRVGCRPGVQEQKHAACEQRVAVLGSNVSAEGLAELCDGGALVPQLCFFVAAVLWVHGMQVRGRQGEHRLHQVLVVQRELYRLLPDVGPTDGKSLQSAVFEVVEQPHREKLVVITWK